MDGVSQFFVNQADVRVLAKLLVPEYDVIRLYQHWPSNEMSWWEASVPLSRGGKNRQVLLQGMAYDVELATSDFVAWIEDFEQCGMTLLQSKCPLPYDLHPLRFRNDPSFLAALKQNGAGLLFEMPHPVETSRLTLFDPEALKWAQQSGVPLREETAQ